jgi:hypothetical protein
VNRRGVIKRWAIPTTAREVAGDMPRETFEKAVEAAAKAVCAHRSYRMIAAEVLASVNHAEAVDLLREIAESDPVDNALDPDRNRRIAQSFFAPSTTSGEQ